MEIEEIDDLPHFEELGNSLYNPVAELIQEIKQCSSFDACVMLLQRLARTPFIGVNEASKNILYFLVTESSFTTEEKFRFLTDKLLFHWNPESVFPVFLYWMYNIEEPLLYNILACQFILQHLVSDFDMILMHQTYCQERLYGIAKDSSYDVKLRAECADILIRLGTRKYRVKGSKIINELGNNTTNAFQTFYSNSQNIHDEELEKSCKNIIDSLVQEIDIENDSLDSILEYLKDKDDVMMESFKRIVMDTALFHGLSMAQIMLYVWKFMGTHEYKEHLLQRFEEELVEMHGWCGSGHYLRIINILQGYHRHEIRISVFEEIKSCVFARVHALVRQSQLQEELILELSLPEKPLLTTFLQEHTKTIYHTLLSEYKDMITQQDFDHYFEQATRIMVGDKMLTHVD
jgi:hypothetical protein